MRRIAASLLLLPLVFAQKPEKTAAELEAEKRDPKKRAVLLLDSAVDSAAAVKPETLVAVLTTVGQHYTVIDRKRAIEYLRQSFAATAALADHPTTTARSAAQANVIQEMARLDTGEAAVLLAQMEPSTRGADFRTTAAASLIDALVAKKDYGTALSVFDSVSGSGSFSYGAAQRLFKAIPAEDPRRLSLFAAATSAYMAKQDNQFGQMLVACWDDLPSDMAGSALDSFVKQILALKEGESFEITTMSGVHGAVHFDRKSDLELFKVFPLVNRADPKKAKELLDSRPALRSAIEKFPEGPKSIEVRNVSSRGGSGPPPAAESGAGQLSAIAESRAAAAAAMLSKDTGKALAMASDVPLPEVRAKLLGTIAQSMVGKDPVTASAALSKAIALLDEIKEPAQRVEPWSLVADAAHTAKEDKLGQKAVERLLADAGDLLKLDANEESPNIATRDQWPSTQAYRKAMIAAAKVMGVDAEVLLDQIKDPDLRVMAQVDLAGALLGRPRQSWSTSVNRSRRR